MAEHCEYKLMVKGELIPKSMQPRHPLAAPEMNVVERGASDTPPEMHMCQAHACRGWMLWKQLPYTLHFIRFPQHFLYSSDPHRTAEGKRGPTELSGFYRLVISGVGI